MVGLFELNHFSHCTVQMFKIIEKLTWGKCFFKFRSFYIVIVVQIPIQIFWPRISTSFLAKINCKNILRRPKISLIWPPNFNFILLDINLFPLQIINPAIKHSFKAHITRQSRKPLRITKNINLPSNLGHLHPHLLAQKPMTPHIIINQIIIIRNSFIGTTHASTNNIKPAAPDQIPDQFLSFIILPNPPHFEKSNLSISKSSIWIFV